MTYKLLPQDTVSLSQPLLIREFGEKGARLLFQIHYWTENAANPGKMHGGHKWVYNNEKEWAKQVVCSTRTLRRQVEKLCVANVIFKDQLNENQSDRTNYFRVNYEEVAKRWPGSRSFVHEDKVAWSSGQDGPFLIRTEITTKINNNINNKNFSKKMLETWNDLLGKKTRHVMTKKLEDLLESVLKAKFEEDLEKWKSFCKLISSSNLLMGEHFQLSLFSLLSPKGDMVERILRGELGVKLDSPHSVDNSVITEESIEAAITTLQENEGQKNFRKLMLKQLGHGIYWSWFHSSSVEQTETYFAFVPPPEMDRFLADKWDTYELNKVNAKIVSENGRTQFRVSAY